MYKGGVASPHDASDITLPVAYEANFTHYGEYVDKQLEIACKRIQTEMMHAKKQVTGSAVYHVSQTVCSACVVT